jgi:DNA repair protein SbcC/Rad50
VRPVTLEMEGFTAFRNRTTVDFEGVDLFALCGPTGAGKTSVVDAITFALYGSVPRLDGRSVAPIVSQSAVEARVRLDFTVGGTGYSVVRVVRDGSTREARLERRVDGEAIADKARELTDAVEALLGLDYHQFTTCVSLPQGEFARFLHAEPSKRQDLLVRLLGLGLYDRVRELAGARSTEADRRRAVAEGQLAELADATPEAERETAERVKVLSALATTIDEAAPAMAAWTRAAEAAEAAAVAAEAGLALLAGVAVPDGVGELAAEVSAAGAACEAAHVADDVATAALERAERELAGLPARTSLEALVQARAEHDREADRVEVGEAFVAEAAAKVATAAAALARTEAAERDADAALQAARTASMAHTLAAGLVVGEPCPVCAATVTEAPHAAPADVAAAEAALQRAKTAVTKARDGLATATKARDQGEAKLAELRQRVATLAAKLAGAPADLEAQLERVTAAEAEVAAARSAAAAAAADRKAADARVRAAAQAEADGRRAFDAARDRVAALGPPAPARADLAADWAELAAWVADRRPVLEVEVVEHRKAAAEARDALQETTDRLATMARRVGVDLAEVATAKARAEAALEQIRTNLRRADELRLVLTAATESRDVARSVADHLKADRFERWLLDEALQQLVVGATSRLHELTAGAYTLVLDDKTRAFAVVDHVNAGQVRGARTLSGGETFLTSLALALALADQIAAMAAGSAARLETVLLDEGFGTLDPDALDVVATALEELGASGRMVGVVTHVQELAERLPVRFQVAKVGGAATIARVG